MSNVQPGPNKTRRLDQEFSGWYVKNFAGCNSKLQPLVEAVSHAVHLKHTCLDLDLVRQGRLHEPVLEQLVKSIDAALVSELPEQGTVTNEPLLRSASGNLVWLQKYHAFEQFVAGKLLDMVKENRLAIVTGGPGTGKTWTVAQSILCNESGDEPNTKDDNQLQAIKHIRELIPVKEGSVHYDAMALAAPTGKAANNMMVALGGSSFKDADAIKPKTLHSMLGIGRHSPKPRYNGSNPLPYRLVIVDEASMIDLPMMYRLLSALSGEASLLLLGDRDQLASVEAGSVLFELCATNAFSGVLTELTESRRYKDQPEIGELAQALNQGEVPDLSKNKSVLFHRQRTENPWEPAWKTDRVNEIKEQHKALKGKTVKKVLEEQKQFQILCALREGPFGVNGINSMIERDLGKRPDAWYPGKPVMVTRNDHDRKLYNGDVGMVLPVDEAGDMVTACTHNQDNLRACFLVGETVKTISLAQMPAYETCYAITVHKSQGSEYDHVMIILPPDDAEHGLNPVLILPPDGADHGLNPVLTRELVYTAVTRAKNKVDLWAGEKVLEAAAKARLQRMSGLRELLG
jgi:exodeoxyribonuclease V alpha subunit